MEDYEPGRVYENLILMMGYRNVQITEPILNQETLVQKLNANECVTIVGTRPENDPRGKAIVEIILIKPESNFASKLADFKRLTKYFPKLNEQYQKLEVIIVSDMGLSSHIKKYIEQSFASENPNTRMEDYDYEIFTTEVPKSDLVPKHEIVTTEVEEFCAGRYMQPSSFPAISQTDPVAVWLGVRPGMVVKVYRVSDTAGKSIAYRYCNK